MPSHLLDVEVDWGWQSLNAAERDVVRRHEALLQADKKAHTIFSAEEALARAARELRGRVIRARAVDEFRSYHWQVIDGVLAPCEDFDEAGMFPEDLTADDFRAAGVTVVHTALAFPESMLHTMNARTYDGSISALVHGAWLTAADQLPAGFRVPTGPRRIQSVYLPVEVWAEIKDRARTEDRSMSYVVQRAVTAAYELPIE